MYITKLNKKADRKEIAEFVRKNNFGVLIISDNNVPIATHIPLELFEEDEKWIIKGHMARANKQWESFEKNEEALVIFSDANTYISSSWYKHLNVPTWNYIAVHLYGKINLMDAAALRDFVTYQMNFYEAASAHPVKMEHFTEESIGRQLRGIVGFEFHVQDIQASYKLSQNRNEEDFANVIKELEKRKDAHSHEIARQMRKIHKK